MVRLGDICTKITDGSHNPAQGIPHSEYLMLSSKNIYDDEITLDNPRYLSAENYATENKRTQISTGDILLTIVGTVGRAAVVSDSYKNICLQRSVAVIKPKSSLIDSRFLMYQLQSMRTHLEQEARGVAQKGIYLKQVENLQVKVPSMDEQFRVVKKLDKVSELIALRKEQLAKLDQLVKSRFVELFGDPTANPMGWAKVNITAVVGGKVSNGFFAKRDDYCDDGNVKVLGVAHVVNRMYSNIGELPRTNGTEVDVAKYGVKYGDMLFCRSSLVAEGIGKASIVPKETPNNVLFECHVIRLPLDLDKCVPEFMQVLSTTDYFRNQVIAQSKTATMTTIGQDGILKTEIILPPLDLQKKFLKFVEQTDKSKLAIQHSLDKLELLKKTLMQEYLG